jgi:hypothetical protein
MHELVVEGRIDEEIKMSKLYGHVWFLKYFENLEIKAGL